MSAEVLRRAAALMRERAEVVGAPDGYPSPWSSSPEDHIHYEVLCHEDGSGLVTDDLDREVAEHIASWHPAVALAVADWLELIALGCPRWESLNTRTQDAALAVARAYLGDADV